MMSIPSATKAWTVNGTKNGFDELQLHQALPISTLGSHDVLVKFEYASLNYRDALVPKVNASPKMYTTYF
jgi:NADPH:quinone reductase-like Zn-dependent oxidoreductase